MKAGKDYPLLVAVLMQTKSMRAASDQLNRTLDQSLTRAQASYTAVIDRGTAALLEATDLIRRAKVREFEKMIGKAQGRRLGEVPAIKRDLERFTNTLIAKLRKEGSPDFRYWNVAFNFGWHDSIVRRIGVSAHQHRSARRSSLLVSATPSRLNKLSRH